MDTGQRLRRQKTKLSPEIEKLIGEAIALGMSKHKAAKMVGIEHTTLYRWVEQGEADIQSDQDTAYSTLCTTINQAEAAFQGYALQMIHDAAVKQWQAAAWLLERRNPEEWALKKDRVEAASPELIAAAVRHLEKEVAELEHADTNST